jgi:hypothetical protein
MDEAVTKVWIIKAHERNAGNGGFVGGFSDPTVIAGRVIEVEPHDPYAIMSPEDLVALCVEELESRR